MVTFQKIKQQLYAIEIIILTVLVSSVLGSDFASWGYAKGAAEYLKLPRHAHSAALSNAVTAWSEEMAGMQYNPAILDGISSRYIPVLATYSFLSQDKKHFSLDAALNVGEFIVTGLSLNNFGVENIEGRDSLGNLTETFEYGTNVFTFSIAGRLKWHISWGFSGRFIHENLADEKAYGLGFDIGAIYNPIEQLSIGISGQNLFSHIWWTTGNDDPILATARLGISGKFLDTTLITGFDLAKTVNQPLDIALGVQYKFLKVLYFRAGFATSIYIKHRKYRHFDFSLGLGFRYNRYGADYALPIKSSRLGLTHKISVSFKLPSFL